MKYKLLNKNCVPYRAHETDAGMDLRSSISVTIPPQHERTIPLGIATEVPLGFAAILIPRSGIGSKGLILRNTIGIIDTDWRGEWLLKVKNRSYSESIKIDIGDRIVQCLVIPVSLVDWNQVKELTDTERGDGGFGHTGK